MSVPHAGLRTATSDVTTRAKTVKEAVDVNSKLMASC